MLRLTYDPQGPKTPTFAELIARVRGIQTFVGDLQPKLHEIAKGAGEAIAARQARERSGIPEMCSTAALLAGLREEMQSC